MKRLGFDMKTDTVPLEDFEFASKEQYSKAKAYGATRMWKYRYCLYWNQIPDYVRQEIVKAGYEAIRVGSTTYQNSTWALRPKQEVKA